MWSLIVTGAATFLLNRAVPAIWHHHTQQPTKDQIELSKDLCENHGDCSAEKMWATGGVVAGVEPPVPSDGF